MKAAVFGRFGGPEVIVVKDVKAPEAGADEVLVKIDSTCVNSADSRIRSLNVPTGFKLILRLINGPFCPRKKILGVDGSGTVVNVGPKTTKFKVGDRVLVFPGMAMGCHAELMKISESGMIVKIPDKVSFAQAAACVFGGTTALLFLRGQAQLQASERIMIIGATGAVGSAAVQIARNLGAHVTAVCSGKNKELALQLGADHVIDYQLENPYSGSQKFDVIMDCVGDSDLSVTQKLLSEKGRNLLVVAGLPKMLEGVVRNRLGEPKVISGDTFKLTSQTLKDVLSLVEAEVFRPVIDRILPLEKIQDAHRLVDSGHKKGAVVIRLSEK